MALIIIIALGVVLGIAMQKGLASRLGNGPKPQRVFFWAWTSQKERARIIRAKTKELYPERFINDVQPDDSLTVPVPPEDVRERRDDSQGRGSRRVARALAALWMVTVRLTR